MRLLTRILFSLPQNGGAHGAPARERRGASGPPQATEPGCGAEPHVSDDRRGSFCSRHRVHLDRSGLCVQRAHDVDFLSREFFRRLLVAERVHVFAVVQNVGGVVRADAGNGAIGIGRSHAHLGVTGPGAHVVRNGAGERLLALGCGQRGNCEQTQEQRYRNAHGGTLLESRCHEVSGRCARIHDPDATQLGIVGQPE